MSHDDSTVTRTLDEANATALVTMEGLGLFCFNDARQYEGGFLRLPPRHVLKVTITGLDDEPRPVRGNGDIRIEVVNPVREGMFRFEKGDFHRPTHTSSDDRDFRWIADIEGEVHNQDLIKRRGPGMRRLFINHATVFTKEIRDEVYVLIRITGTGGRCRFYGKQARVVGAALECRDGGGIRIRSEGAGGEEIWLPKRDGPPYGINFDNDCDIGPRPTQSDFVLFYEVLSDIRGDKFDLRLAADFGPPAELCENTAFGPKFIDGMGLACDKGYLRHTSSLPD